MNRLGKLFMAAALAVVPMACKDDVRKDADKAAENLQDKKENLREESKQLKEAIEEQREASQDYAKARAGRSDDGKIAGLPEKAVEKANEAEVKNNAKEIVGESKDVAKKAGEMTTAESTFDLKRYNRVQQLRAVHTIIAMQPALISTLASVTALTDRARADVAEKLQIFQMRIDEAGNAIEMLQMTSENNFKDRNDAAAKAVERLDDARGDAWEALNDGDRIQPS
jgi:hypothetical protein